MMLREITKKDESLIEDLNRRQEVSRFIGGFRDIGTKPSEKVIERVIETDVGVSAGIVAISKSQALNSKDHELICALLPDHEGHGLATEACSSVLNEISHDPSVHRVIGCVHRENTSSLELIKRLGGTFLQHRKGIYWEQDIYFFK